MDNLDYARLGAAIGQQAPGMLYGSAYPSASSIKRQQQPYKGSTPRFAAPTIYNSIEDWSAAELTCSTDSAPSPGSGSPISPIFAAALGDGFSDESCCWASTWGTEQSPEPDLFRFKSELLDAGPDLTAIPALDAQPRAGLDDVVFGREGVNDTKPLFQPSPPHQLSLTGATMARPCSPAQALLQHDSNSTTMGSGLPTPPEASVSPQQQQQQQETRRYPARNNLKRKSSEASSSSPSSTTPSSPRSSCSPPPPQRRHTNSSSSSCTSPSKDDPHHHHHHHNHKPTLGPKKTAHNMIEKRYRTNLNDKIAALRDSVPALRVMVHRLEGDANNNNDDCRDVMDEIKAEAGLDADDDLGGLTPAHKLNKATILSKATEYIAHLERKNRALASENAALRNRVDGFEVFVMSRGGGGAQRTAWS